MRRNACQSGGIYTVDRIGLVCIEVDRSIESDGIGREIATELRVIISIAIVVEAGFTIYILSGEVERVLQRGKDRLSPFGRTCRSGQGG